jgi:hypothetical protein
LTEAVVLGHAPGEVVALSLGTGTVTLPLAPPGPPAPAGAAASPYLAARSDSGIVADLRKLATAILDDPPDAATFIAHVMTGGGNGVPAPAISRIVRMNPLIAPVTDAAGNWTAPAGMTVSQFKYLCNVGMDAVDPNEVLAIQDYCAAWLRGSVRNQPLRMKGDTLEAQIGYTSFPEAKAAWEVL